MNEHTLDPLRTLPLDETARVFEKRTTSTTAATPAFDERFFLLVSGEVGCHDDNWVTRPLKTAQL
jgi:hypothetical protein